MKKLLKPIVKAASNYYENTTLTQTARSRTRKIRKYAHIDIQKDFEKKAKKYEEYKEELIESYYQGQGKQIEDPDKESAINLTEKSMVDLIEFGEPDDIKGKCLVSGIRKL
jgi:hypothetical protein